MTDGVSRRVRAILRNVVPVVLRWRWHRAMHRIDQVREYGILGFARWSWQRWLVTARAKRAIRAYRVLTPHEAAARRRSDTVFIFGSGYSLNDVTPDEWAHFSAHDVFGFSGFVYQSWVRADFHLIRSWDVAGKDVVARWPRPMEAFARDFTANPHFRETVAVVQAEYGALTGCTLIGHRLLPLATPILPYRTARRLDDLPSSHWDEGLAHTQGALADTVNAAYLLGWKRIVLVGVDLYDTRYFWGPPDATIVMGNDGECRQVTPVSDRGVRWNEPHLTATRGIVDVMGAWAEEFARESVRLEVYNPRSLMTRVLPVYADGPRSIPIAQRR